MFVKFACGCIGIKSTKPPIYRDNDNWAHALILKSCDSEGEGYGFYYRDVRYDKPETPLTDAEVDAFVDQFGKHLGRATVALNTLQDLRTTLEFLIRTA